MSWIDKLPSIDLVQKLASWAISTSLVVYGAWTIHFHKWKQKRQLLLADKPVAPMPIPPPHAPVPDPLSPPTVSASLIARLARLEAEREQERHEKRTIEQTVMREREIWELQEHVRKLKKEIAERTADCEQGAREITRLRLENRSLSDEIELRDQKIARLNRRLLDSGVPPDKTRFPRDS